MKAKTIGDAARRRGITALYHFTPMANLESILLNGLLSRRVLDEAQADYTCTDARRYDGRPDAVSLSIHGFNGSMFAAKQRGAGCAWVILEIAASVLWTHRCLFSWTNAASAEITKHRGYRGGPWALERMFADRPAGAGDGRSWREVRGLPDNVPTLDDAEVQVLDPIDPGLIRDLSVKGPRERRAAQAAMAAGGRVLPVVIVPDAFA